MRRAELRERFFEMVDRFRQKGAMSPDKAMTVEELGLPPGFEYAMDRHLGKLGVFVEVDGKYYLSERRLEEIQKGGFRAGTIGDSRRKLLLLRILRMATVILFLTVLLANFFISSLEIRMILLAFLIVLLVLSILQIYYLMKIRRRMPSP
jgi:hypothetical protein